MRDLFKKRILFFGGKGGVGKTTCASAMALARAKEGKRVLLVSTDPAHSTSDIFEKPFSREEREIYPGLTGIEIDADFEARRYIDGVKEQIAKLFSSSILKEAERQIELASTMPGVEEVALFDRMGELMVTHMDSYDLVVFDTAPTGHTMRLLRMPELMASWIEALSRRRRNLMKFGQNIEQAGSEPDPILATLERRKEKLEGVRARLMQHNFTGFVLVLVPERLPIEESARTAESLRDANVNVCVAQRLRSPGAFFYGKPFGNENEHKTGEIVLHQPGPYSFEFLFAALEGREDGIGLRTGLLDVLTELHQIAPPPRKRFDPGGHQLGHAQQAHRVAGGGCVEDNEIVGVHVRDHQLAHPVE